MMMMITIIKISHHHHHHHHYYYYYLFIFMFVLNRPDSCFHRGCLLRGMEMFMKVKFNLHVDLYKPSQQFKPKCSKNSSQTKNEVVT